VTSLLGQARPFIAGSGSVQNGENVVRLTLPQASRDRYADAQLDDYAARPRPVFVHRPPLRLSVEARFSSPAILGTAVFGFWNHPFAPGGGMPTLPRALWFFYASPPSDMQLALDVPGHGWKAATIDATRLSALAIAPLAPLAALMNRSRRVYRRTWPMVQRALCIDEQSLPVELMPDWHTYTIDWESNRVTFGIDKERVLSTERAPRGPLGFVAWIDNQFAIVTPTGHVQFGLLAANQSQWLELRSAEVI
jgi:hypothetical protein